MIKSKTVEKSINIKIDEYDNFFVLDRRILLKKHAQALGIDVWGCGYDELKNLRFPAYQVKDKKFCTAIADWEIEHYDRGVDAKNDSYWVSKCYTEEKVPTSKQLEMADANPSEHLLWFCDYDHSLWDVDMIPVSTPIRMDYIEARLDNNRYRLKALHAHLKALPKSLVSDSWVSPILNIPGYNCSEGRDRYIFAEIKLTQEKYVEYTQRCKKQHDRDYATYRKLGYFILDSYDEREVQAEMLGFKQFEKPEVKDDDE